MEVARMYSKDEILEMYFNQIYYGNQSYGVKAAAKTYFGITDLSQLTLGQAALLAGLPQLPSDYDPVVNPEAAHARRQDVLKAMLELGYITELEAQAAGAEPIKVTPAKTPILYPHFVFRAREQLADLLGSDSAAYTGGYRVYTTLDVGLQDIAERDVRNRVAALRGANVNNAAMISMDPRNGQILAYVGSVDYNNNSPKVKGDFDVAGLGERQMGSSFKLFTYLAALRKGFTASTVLWDVSTAFGTYAGREYRPHNAPALNTGRSAENGPLTIRQALRESLNIPAIKVTSLVGVDAIIDTIHDLGLTRDWDRSQIGLSFGIGAGEMTLREITSAYQVVANMGKRVEPTMLLKVVDRDGNVVKDWSQPEAREVLQPQVAWVMTDILKDMTDPNGSPIFGSWTHIGRPAALKTGTTDDIRDVLAIGYVPQLLTAVWMGNSDNTEMFGISSAMGPGVLWKEYMQHAMAHLKLPVAWYDRPGGIVDRVVCAKPGMFGGSGSGLLPSPACPGGWRVTEKFVAGTEPKTDDRGFFGAGCVQPRAERPEWNADIVRWARGGKNGRLGLGICGVSASPSPSPSTSPRPSPQPSGPPPRPQETPRPNETKKP
jgi:membrane peptidoglycan carboxypeptidase